MLRPNDSEELADVVNRAGLWVKDRDEKVGNRYYQIIEQRCPKTEIGRSAGAKHWFVDHCVRNRQSAPIRDALDAVIQFVKFGLQSVKPFSVTNA